MHILIAPNAFKNSLPATDAARCIEQGLLESSLSCTTTCFPVADGGDGTGELLIRSLSAKMIEGRYPNAYGSLVNASFGLIDQGHTAIIEMASASGLRVLDQHELDPMIATTIGTGEMINTALDLQVKKIILTVGGSATVDGGCGILHALGVVFLDAHQNTLRPVPNELLHLRSIDISALDPRIRETDIEIWCDVQNTLLGSQGAAQVFGPQKGATPAQVLQLDDMLQRLSERTRELTQIDVGAIRSGGAAGGVAAFLHGLLGARLQNGIDCFLALTRFEEALENADLVITGEGQIDWQTLQGKGPYGVAMKARSKNIPVIALAGKVSINNDPALTKLFPVLLSIGHQPLPLEELMGMTGQNLIRVSRQVGNILAIN